jgi:hypothetical protein
LPTLDLRQLGVHAGIGTDMRVTNIHGPCAGPPPLDETGLQFCRLGVSLSQLDTSGEISRSRGSAQFQALFQETDDQGKPHGHHQIQQGDDAVGFKELEGGGRVDLAQLGDILDAQGRDQ